MQLRRINRVQVRPTAFRSGNAAWRPVRRISVSVSTVLVFCLCVSLARSAGPDKSPWNLRIVPATKARLAAPAPPAPMVDEMSAQEAGKGAPHVPPQPSPPAMGPKHELPPNSGYNRSAYYDAWRTVPFSRAEYAANPSYRSEATLGLLFNQMPVMSIIKQSGQANVPEYGYITPYRYNRQSGSAMSYNFFYPKPGVYRNY
jgi:hypothetical protein